MLPITQSTLSNHLISLGRYGTRSFRVQSKESKDALIWELEKTLLLFYEDIIFFDSDSSVETNILAVGLDKVQF